jgi:predicted CoA-binding protein
MSNVASLLADPGATVAVVGATDHPGKYGGIVYRRMKALGYSTYAVNPTRATVDGDPCFPDLDSLPEAPTIVNFVVPPKVAIDVAHRAVELGYTNLWFQPGSEPSDVTPLTDRGADVLTQACIMVVARIATPAS